MYLDYQISTILYNVDFFLPIQNLSITDNKLYISNKKRIIIYNYLNDKIIKNQQYYLNNYFSEDKNNRLRYIQTECEDQKIKQSRKEENNKQRNQNNIKQIVPTNFNSSCVCGKLAISYSTPRIIVFIKQYTQQKQKNKAFYIYYQQFDIQQFFINFNPKQPFDFALSSDGQFLAYTIKEGTHINVYSLKERKLYCVLYPGRAIRQILKIKFFKAKIQGDQMWCLGVIRRKDISKATFHIFKIQLKTPTVAIQSPFKRRIQLYYNILLDNQIMNTSYLTNNNQVNNPNTLYENQNKIIGPDFFINQNNYLFLYSFCGIVQQVINFNNSFIKSDKAVDQVNMKWKEEEEMEEDE